MNLQPINANLSSPQLNPILKQQQAPAKSTLKKSQRSQNNINSVITIEMFKLHFIFMIALISFVVTLGLIIYFAVIDFAGVGTYIFLSFLILGSFYKLLVTFYERRILKIGINRYNEDIKLGLSSIPPFITKLYSKLHLKQIKHNWITFTICFYGGFFVLLLWFLKDASWWIFDFDLWIAALFKSPNFVLWSAIGVLIALISIHLFLTILRVKKIWQLKLYFDDKIVDYENLNSDKKALNKFCRRLFVLSLMIFMIIPLLIRFLFKLFRK